MMNGIHESPSRRPRAFLAVAAFLALAGCLLPGPLGSGPKDDITLALREKVIRNLNSSGLTLAFHISVSNRAASVRELSRYRYRVTVNEREFLNMTVGLDDPLSVPSGGATLIALPVKVSYTLLFEAVGQIEEKAACDVVGDMFFRDERNREERVPFAFTGEFPIFKDPEVDFLPLRVNDLTVGGADVSFRPRFRNLNGYELLIDRIGFRLFFGAAEVLSGEVPGDKNVPRMGEKAFDLPFLIDFFEAGEEMRGNFEKPEFPCRFAGEVEVMSVWGRLVIRFDKTQNLRLEKTP